MIILARRKVVTLACLMALSGAILVQIFGMYQASVSRLKKDVEIPQQS